VAEIAVHICARVAARATPEEGRSRPVAAFRRQRMNPIGLAIFAALFLFALIVVGAGRCEPMSLCVAARR